MMPTELRLPTGRAQWQRVSAFAAREGWPAERLLSTLLDDFNYVRRDETNCRAVRSHRRMPRARGYRPAANQLFSLWNQVFPEPAMSVAAIDRLVHHATLLELNVESYRPEWAERDKDKHSKRKAATTTAEN